MSELNIGKIIEGEAARDAIHIAVAPVVAGEHLCASDFLQATVTKLNARVATVLFQAEPPL